MKTMVEILNDLPQWCLPSMVGEVLTDILLWVLPLMRVGSLAGWPLDDLPLMTGILLDSLQKTLP